jgi:predicted DCC family thiol-disulfide oxidoreductase YuxK
VAAWVRRHDKEGRLVTVPFQDAPAPPVTPELRAACEKAIHVLTGDGRVLRAGRASLFVLAALGHKTTARVLGLPPLIWAVEAGYKIVAGNRDFFSRFLFTNDD